MPSERRGRPSCRDGRIAVAAGHLAELPDDDRHVAALVGTARDGHRVVLAGRELGRRSVAGRVRAGLVSVGGVEVAGDVSVEEHLVAVVGAGQARRRLASAPLLSGRAGDPAGVLSGGERRVLGWLVADALAPRAVVLDQPATGLDPGSLAWAHAVLDGWLDAGVAALLRVGRAEERAWLTHRADGRPRRTPRPG